jgi:predicted ATPase
VYRAIAAELDDLPIADKQILRQATLVPNPIDPGSVAAVGQHDVEEARRGLDALARRHLLRHNADSARYEFAQPLVREVAHAQLPRSERAVMPTGGGLSPVPPADRPPRAFRPA